MSYLSPLIFLASVVLAAFVWMVVTMVSLKEERLSSITGPRDPSLRHTEDVHIKFTIANERLAQLHVWYQVGDGDWNHVQELQQYPPFSPGLAPATVSVDDVKSILANRSTLPHHQELVRERYRQAVEKYTGVPMAKVKEAKDIADKIL